MAQAQLIQGSGEELLSCLQQYRSRKNLMLIIPDEAGHDNPSASGENVQNAPAAATLRNGIPLFPTQDATHPVTPELVRQLMEED